MKNMDHPERKAARSYDLPGRSRTFTDIVYSGEGNAAEKYAALTKAEHMFDPPAPEFDLFIGEMHGHTRLSDGDPSIDDYLSTCAMLPRWTLPLSPTTTTAA